MSETRAVNLSFCDGCDLRGSVVDGQYCARGAIDNAKRIFAALSGGEAPSFSEEVIADIAGTEPRPGARILLVSESTDRVAAATGDEAVAAMFPEMLPDMVRCIQYVQEHGERP